MAIGKTNVQNKSTNYWQVQKIEDASFHFKKNDSGYWVNTNAATGNINKNSAAVCKVFFRMAQADKITFTINQDSESGYDYGIIGALNTELTLTNTVDSTVLKNFEDVSGEQTFTTNVPKGEHFVYIKYRKDNSDSNGTDTFQFTITSGATEIESEDGVDVSGVTATAADVLSGETFINAEGELLPGTMTNNSTLTTKALTYDSSTEKFYIPTGYYNGNQTPTSSQITVTEEDVLQNKYFMNSSGERKSGSIMNVSNLYEFEDNYIWLDQEKNSQTVLPGYNSKGGSITVKAVSSTQEIMPTTEAQTIDAGYYNSGFQNWFLTNVTIAGDANLTPENIKSGVSIFGVPGTYSGGNVLTASYYLGTGSNQATLSFSNTNLTKIPDNFIALCTNTSTVNVHGVLCINGSTYLGYYSSNFPSGAQWSNASNIIQSNTIVTSYTSQTFRLTLNVSHVGYVTVGQWICWMW